MRWILNERFLGDAFAKFIGSYLQNGFRKGVPSLFQSVKFLYKTPGKVQGFHSRRIVKFILVSIGCSDRITDEQLSGTSRQIWDIRSVDRFEFLSFKKTETFSFVSPTFRERRSGTGLHHPLATLLSRSTLWLFGSDRESFYIHRSSNPRYTHSGGTVHVQGENSQGWVNVFIAQDDLFRLFVV